MADRDLYREKQIKKAVEKQNRANLKPLIIEMERLRDELNKKIFKDSNGISSEETLIISEKLDELIIKYLKMKIRN